MNRASLFFVLALPLVGICPAAAQQSAVLSASDVRAQGGAAPLAFTNVTVIDATGAPAKPGMTVIVAGDRIWGLGKTDSMAVPTRATVIDATGKYLIPGLWDMHAHLDDALWREGYATTEEKETFLALLVANGVTGVRLPGDFIEQVSAWRHRIQAGDLLGPRIVAADRPLEGGALPFPGWVRVETEAEARAAVRSQVRRGADFIKVYDGLTREAYFAMADEAGRLGVDFVGHPPYVVSAAEAAAAGQKSIEHLTGTTYQCTDRADELHAEIQEAVAEKGRSLTDDPVHGIYLGWDPRIAASFDPRRCREMLAAFVEHGTWHVPTLTVFAGLRGWVGRDRSPGLAPDPRERYLPAAIPGYWREAFDIPGSALPMFEAGAATAFRMTRALHEAGVRLMAGTDFATVPYTFPGFSLHDELAHLAEAGLSPMEALQTATLNPALYLGRAHSGGSIAIGKLADLVLLDADPLADIRNTRRIRAVVLNGRYLDRNALDAILAGVARSGAYSGPILDMHLHGASVSQWGVEPPVGICAPFAHLRTRDPAQPYDEFFSEQYLKGPPCPDPVWSPESDAEVMRQTLVALEQYNIIGVVSSSPDNVAAWRAAAPERVIPGLDFDLGSEDRISPDSLRSLFATGAVEVFGEILNAYVGIAPDDPRMEPYWALAEELDVPVAIHVGGGPPGEPYAGRGYRARLESPLTMEEVLVRHPRMRVYLMHAGYPMLDDLLAVLGLHPQVYVDIGAIVYTLPREEFYRYLQGIMRAGFGHRVMFGSDQMDWPQTIERSITVIEQAPFLSAEQKADIFYDNAARFLRLSDETIARHQAMGQPGEGH